MRGLPYADRNCEKRLRDVARRDIGLTLFSLFQTISELELERRTKLARDSSQWHLLKRICGGSKTCGGTISSLHQIADCSKSGVRG